jgi:uncharacterized repeat protein (TIGR01451 family)
MSVFGVRCSFLVALVAVCALVLPVPAGALAAEVGTAQWTVSSVSRPTSFKPDSGSAGEDTYVVLVTNTGGAASTGTVVVTDELPAGLTLAAGASGEATLGGQTSVAPYREAPRSMECVLFSCTYAGPVAPGETLAVTFPVRVAASEGTLTNVVRVAGGGAPTASMRTPTTISQEPAPFGVAPGARRRRSRACRRARTPISR